MPPFLAALLLVGAPLAAAQVPGGATSATPPAASAPSDSTLENSRPAAILPQVEVRATRLETDPRRNASRVDVLLQPQIASASNSSATIAQFVQQIPGVGGLGRDGYNTAPTIRGLGRGRSLVLVEGMNITSDRGVGPSGAFLDPTLVQRVEVVRGSAGVAYGSGAIGGVLAYELGSPGCSVASARFGASTAERGQNAAIAFQKVRALDSAGDAATAAKSPQRFVGGFLRTQSDYSVPNFDGSGSDRVPNSGFENYGGAFVAEQPWRDGTLRFAGIASQASDVGRPTTAGGRKDTVLEDDHGIGVMRYFRNLDGRRLETTLGLHRPKLVNRSERINSAGEITRFSDLVNESWDGTGSVLVERPALGGAWIAGADAFVRRDVIATETTTRFSDGVAGSPDQVELLRGGSQTDAGAFAGWKQPLANGVELLFAARGDWSHRGAESQDEVTWVSPSLTASATVPFGPRLRGSAILARSYRAPQAQELFFEGNRPSGYRLPNPDLEPETALSAELGLAARLGAWSVSTALWGMNADDFIVQLPVDDAGDTLRFENVTEAELFGGEAFAEWSSADRGTAFNFGYARIRGEDQNAAALPDVPSGELTVGARRRVWGHSTARAAMLRVQCRAGGAKTPFENQGSEAWWSKVLGSSEVGGDEVGHRGYAFWDAGMTLGSYGGASIDVAVTNLLDSRQIDRPEPDAFPDPGRSFHVQIRVGE